MTDREREYRDAVIAEQAALRLAYGDTFIHRPGARAAYNAAVRRADAARRDLLHESPVSVDLP